VINVNRLKSYSFNLAVTVKTSFRCAYSVNLVEVCICTASYVDDGVVLHDDEFDVKIAVNDWRMRV